ncbi:MAG: histidine kinase [Syntrophomonadaceae bacterium]|nr:histidine kinase [Syntrophomonadaceae bacterium]
MKYEESFIINDNLGPPKLEHLNRLLKDIIDSLEKGRNDIFEIGEKCREEISRLELELLDIRLKTQQIIQEVDHYELLEKQARIRLMTVSKNFQSKTEDDIKEAYDNARKLQAKFLELRNQEIYLRKRRDEIARQIKNLEEIAKRAENFLNTTGLALKLLQGNIERISGSLEDIYRKQQMELYIIESQESERRKIARELHDGPAQTLASMLIRLDLLSHLCQEGQDQIKSELKSIKNMGQESLADIRRLMFDLKPTIDHEDSFASTLKEYFDDYETKYNFYINFMVFGPHRKYDLSLERALYRLVQESLTNIRKHAGVNEATVKMEDKGGYLTLVIKDEGKGFNLDEIAHKHESYGILGMQERVELLGGEISIITSPGLGTQVIIKVPVKEEAK